MRKVYLITGASSDIGMEFIQTVSQKEPETLFYAHYRTMNDQLRDLKTKLDSRIKLVQADLAKADEVLRMITVVRETPTHILHLPASKIEYKRFRQIEVKTLQKEMQIQVYSLLEIYRAFLPKMAKAGYGRSVAVATSCTTGIPPKFLGIYTTTKYALLGLAKSASVEYAGKGIHINVLSPNMVETKFLDVIDRRVVEITAQQSVIGRNLTVKEVITALEFLLADDNPMCGENLLLG